MRRWLLPPLLALSLMFAAGSAQAISALYSFGDSLSDRGNALIATGGAQPLPAFYSDGRFSNGAIWVEPFSAMLGLPAPVPFLAGGTNFAIGGARTGVTALTPTNRPNDLPAQVVAYLAGSPAPAGSLFSVWIGSNDIVFSLLEGTSLATVVPQAVGNTLGAIGALAGLGGARDFLILGVPDLGKVPLFSGNPLASVAASTASAAFNASLLAQLGTLPLPPGTRLSFLDTAALIDGAITNPGAFGFANVTQPCFTGDSSTPGTVCSPNPAVQNSFLFWDGLHPTKAGHALVAAAALAVVPAPGALGLMLAGLVGMTLLRRRAT